MTTNHDTRFVFRDARPEDREEVLGFTSRTWEFGDYIHYVFDEWLSDPGGRFVIAEEAATGRIAAIDKLTMLSPTEAWFEGLRVRPEYRGAGLATDLQHYFIAEAARLGAGTARLLTLLNNLTIHRKAYRDGFRRLFIVRFWKWTNAGEPVSAPFALRQATEQEAPILFDWWLKVGAQPTCGLIHQRWNFREGRCDDWAKGARRGLLYVRDDVDLDREALPPASVLLARDTTDDDRPNWTIAAFCGQGDDTEGLARALCALASRLDVPEIYALAPDTYLVQSGLRAAGFEPEPDEDRLCVFELAIAGELHSTN